jgi:leucyl aminopeptidase
MLSMHLTKKKFWDNAAEGYVFFLKENLEPASPLASLDLIEQKYYPQLRNILKKHLFEGKRGQSFVLSGTHNKELVQFIFIGLGKLEDEWYIELEHLRRAMATAVHILKKLSITSALIAPPEEKPFGVSNTELLKQLALTAHMASYEFITFKSEKKKTKWNCKLNFVMNPNYDERSFSLQLSMADIIGNAINNARHWADMPANIMTPTAIAAEAKKVADKYELPCTIFGREKALELGMGGFCAVDAGSDQDGKFIALEYRTSKKKAPTVVLVGKGVAFDTGGVNLKPTSAIEGMKYDMSGAASVIAMMEIFAQLKPEINVIALAPCVENMPSGKASRPDDIITCMNGKTVEIKNTDAEGRLILADALCYAEKNYKPDYIFDIATLTGAVLYALGHLYTGVMTKDHDLAHQLIELGKLTGDRAWELPLDDDFKEAIKCDVADIHNNSNPSYYAGTIIGGCFLQNFVEKARWAHLDVAGTAHGVTGVNYVGKGATGASIRLLVAFVMNLNQH